jgi:hypothetical protein
VTTCSVVTWGEYFRSTEERYALSAETYFDCTQLTTWAETVPEGWGTPRLKSDDSRVKNDSAELGILAFLRAR